jgi:hypothetical protein
MKNKTQRRIQKYFLSHYFCFVFFRKISSEGMRQPNEGEKKSARKSQGSRKVTVLTCRYHISSKIFNNLLKIHITQLLSETLHLQYKKVVSYYITKVTKITRFSSVVSVHVGMNISGTNDLTCYYDNSYES